MDVEVLIAGSSRRIIVRIPRSHGYTSNVMAGVHIPQQIQLSDCFPSLADKENISRSGISLPATSSLCPLSSSTDNQFLTSESHSRDIRPQLSDQTHASVLQCAKVNIPLDINMQTDDISQANVYNQKIHSSLNSIPSTTMELPGHISNTKKGIESQTSKLVAQRIVYLADAAVFKLFGPTEMLAPEFIPHARQLRQQLISTLVSVVKEHLQQRISTSTCPPSPQQLKRQLIQEDDFQRTLRPTIQTRVR